MCWKQNAAIDYATTASADSSNPTFGTADTSVFGTDVEDVAFGGLDSVIDGKRPAGAAELGTVTGGSGGSGGSLGSEVGVESNLKTNAADESDKISRLPMGGDDERLRTYGTQMMTLDGGSGENSVFGTDVVDRPLGNIK